MKKCIKCNKDVNHLRRGMCLKCYRIYTNLSGGDQTSRQVKKELEKMKQRIKIIEEKLVMRYKK